MTDKELIIFDLDGTLTESKQKLDATTAELLIRLLGKKKVAIIGGAKFSQLKQQFLNPLDAPPALLENLFLFPTDGAAGYRFGDGNWQQIYAENLTSAEKQIVRTALTQVLQELNYIPPETLYGETVEDRDTQITFSALGQAAPLAAKEKWLTANAGKRRQIAERLQAALPDFSVRVAGLTSIDITRRGIDKAYALRQMNKRLSVPLEEMLFVGDALFPGGNDYPVIGTGVDYIAVSSPAETVAVIQTLI